MTKFTDHPGQEETDEKPSKSQRKRDMKDLQKLGKQLVEAPEYILKNMNLDEELTNAILLARRLGNNPSISRQLQYLGKLLNQVDTDEIKKVLDTHSLQQKKVNQEFHALEKWRDKLIKDGNVALNELLDEHKNLDRQHLRQLIRNAQKEESLKKPPASSRAIFSYLKENMTKPPQ